MEISVRLEPDNIFRQQMVRVIFNSGQFAGGVDIVNEKMSIADATELMNQLKEVLGDLDD